MAGNATPERHRLVIGDAQVSRAPRDRGQHVRRRALGVATLTRSPMSSPRSRSTIPADARAADVHAHGARAVMPCHHPIRTGVSDRWASLGSEPTRASPAACEEHAMTGDEREVLVQPQDRRGREGLRVAGGRPRRDPSRRRRRRRRRPRSSRERSRAWAEEEAARSDWGSGVSGDRATTSRPASARRVACGAAGHPVEQAPERMRWTSSVTSF